MTTQRRKRHTPEQIVRKLRDADAMLNAGQDEAAVLQALEVSEATYLRWKNQYGGMKSAEARRLKELEDEDRRLNGVAWESARTVASTVPRSTRITTWCWDFVFDRTVNGSPLKWLSIVDEYTRECLALKVDRHITSEDVIDTLA